MNIVTITISGKPGSGKTTIAALICDILYEYNIQVQISEEILNENYRFPGSFMHNMTERINTLACTNNTVIKIAEKVERNG